MAGEQKPSRLDTIAFAMVAVVAFAIPWETFQRIPIIGIRITSVAAMIMIPCAIILWWQRGRPNFASRWMWPLALYVLACVFSILFTTDAEQSATGLLRLAAAIPFFAAMCVVVDRLERVHILMAIYAVSATMVAAVVGLCMYGELWPTAWQAPQWFTGRAIDMFNDAMPLRLSATRQSFEITTLEAVVGIVCAWFALPARRGIIVLLARLCAITLLAGAVFLAAPHGGIVDAIVGAPLDEYVDAWRALLPVAGQCAIFGCGIGVGDSAVAAVTEDVTLAIPSALLRVLIETGAIGLIAALWIFIAGVRAAAQPKMNLALIAIWLVGLFFIVTRDIPLITLASFVLALMFGPRENDEKSTSPTWPTFAVVASTAIAIAINMYLFQSATTLAAEYADLIDHDRIEATTDQYDAAILVADELEALPAYRFEAESLMQLETAYAPFNMPAARPSPSAAARYMAGMSHLAIGDWEAARDRIEAAVGLDGQFRIAHYALAEAAWREGRFVDALVYYRVSPMPSPATVDASLQNAAALRRNGDWEGAVALYREFAQAKDALAEVWFNLGVAAELENDWPTAKAYYERALKADPNHLAAQRELRLGE